MNKQSLKISLCLIILYCLWSTNQIQSQEIKKDQNNNLKELSCGSKPQKKAYISFDALSRRDDLRYVFQHLNKQIIKYDFIYNKTQDLVYNMSSMHPQFYYNQHHQIDSYVDQYTARVNLGVIEMAYRFDYEIIQKGNIIKKGWARGKQFLDPNNFTKKIISDNGTIQWQPSQVGKLTISSQLFIDYSDPKFSNDQLSIFQQMLNDNVGTRKLKQTILASANLYYSTLLKQYLNSQHMFANTKFDYYWKGVYFHFITPQKDVKLVSNNTIYGLQGGFFLQLDNVTQNCSDVPDYLQVAKYGGLQQMISMATINSAFKYALNQKVFDAYLYSNWEVPQFQFRMGDLANVVPEAQKYAPGTYLFIQCAWNKNSTSEAKVYDYAKQTLKSQIPYECIVKNSTETLVKVTGLFQFFIKIVPQVDYLNMVIDGTGLYGVKFEAIDSAKKFVVQNQLLAQEYIYLILNNMKGSLVFGTNWKTQMRRFPSAYVQKDYIAIYDVSQQ